ncbi:glycerophosphoryl diester phosphodiesterase membrane domain-containing protein [Jonesia denitrificans]|uniref:Glycerophosphoryl diester phosphodiesterase membrane domain-containing protein n=1 Tax=Jonesia denitrificans (strain ATCC 14870 / DSM 20603 / BCRC 15368 / CIP 55.134 / JCM 11481 / NBRC 15587 / NCTC 10816 / Prevot 55134) TaxID=471856 RepID=C7QZH4_JONDD|nr:glycerophosphoryl diester phosphodiesterase membrane domain-containing protein [Jonesia denitrificans]ACV09472.1 hypothetical protein Jden_1829 [Jonesia denitrificans DSM 20603]ASE09289.1 hypothetical protein CEP80_09155 [Jonesia denitrificans]QXB43831.1 glycerophosphoryl diester phosphodiesterase membrane domain-containing protein [Jonesia denitrificans]SQH21833.1 Membrane domain of membrane-anchored glycerophosphoryl diester phosphodiesterase [Jonesia denitrificans]
MTEPQDTTPTPPSPGEPPHNQFAPPAPSQGTPPPPNGTTPPPAQPAAPQPQYGQYAPPGGTQPQYGQPDNNPQQPPLPQYGQAAYGQQPMPYNQLPSAPSYAPRQGIIPLRPLGLGGIFDGAFQAVRRAPGALLGLTLVIVAVFSIIGAAIGYILTPWVNRTFFGGISTFDAGTDPTFEMFSMGPGSFSITYLVAMAAGVSTYIASAAIIAAIGQLIINKPAPIGATWDRVRGRFWAILGVAFAVGLIIILPWVLLVLAIIAAENTGVGSNAFGGFLLAASIIGLLIWTMYASIRWLYAPMALLLEEQSVTGAMRRSWDLVKGSWWRTFGIYLLASVVVQFIISTVGGFVELIRGFTLGYDFDTDFLALGSYLVIQIVVNTLAIAFLSSVMAMMYIDTRIRKEALDVQLAQAMQ